MNFPHDNMITLKSVFFKSNIKKYYDYCEKTDFFTFSCPSCQCPGYLVKHGYYQRTIIINGVKKSICILRIKCKSCGKTHAVLPDFIIPYLQTSIDDAMIIIKGEIDTNAYFFKRKLILDSYNKWINRVLSAFSSLNDALSDLHQLFIVCSESLKLCFLQNHKGKYLCL
jgi:hypothetical protein